MRTPVSPEPGLGPTELNWRSDTVRFVAFQWAGRFSQTAMGTLHRQRIGLKRSQRAAFAGKNINESVATTRRYEVFETSGRKPCHITCRTPHRRYGTGVQDGAVLYSCQTTWALPWDNMGHVGAILTKGHVNRTATTSITCKA